ncbi:HET-domain-containing protein [Xylaria bambusicola]|uniref:HET-domain-containing protein n=1 Tax=Xylaria bambusicola TaxID=326684 RepID=UPI002007DBA5|nr:HET-domain-containing protein [Xylaria bambusicola]KAI0505296.1 HET-domain-containing protein [Xylaria bambusicola]
MRLLHCETLTFEDFVQDIPPYAILSHTWGDQEVSLGDMDNRDAASQLDGYEKIAATCRIAREQGLDYAWVDTCCIDKSSSAELSEAINSMFAWYRNATTCYAWLSDYAQDAAFNLTEEVVLASFESREAATEQDRAFSDPPPLTSKELDMRNHIGQTLGKCRWFSRGWTLQELIAPKHVEFYDRDWKCFGSKAQLAPILSWITGVDTGVLKGGSLDQVLVGRRMSWAANRQTRRIEDMAYCLLGIFDINMPLLYGEGEKAFTRLQEEIIRSSNDLSIFAWTAALKDKRAFRSLWASSPNEFKSCQFLVKPALEWNGRGEYSITSRGLRTTDMIRTVRGNASRKGSYFLPLDCVDARQKKDIRFVSLEQYGPSLFARRKPWLYDTVVDIDVSQASRLPQAQYICCRESPDFEAMVRTSRVGSVQIDFSLEVFDETSVTAQPETDWDLRNSILLSYRRRHFWGCWRIRTVSDDPGVCVVCVQSDGWLLYGIFSWENLPPAMDQSDLLPSQVADMLQELPVRTSVRCHPWCHTVELSEHEIDDSGDGITGTLLRIKSRKATSMDDGRTTVKTRLQRLFKKKTWP